MVDVLIAGGGVIGLSVAHVLSREGVRCALIDKGQVGREASWAGAGLLPGISERIRSSPLNELRSWSALLYPEWSERLRDETGIDNGYWRCGGVDVAATEAEEDDLRVAAGRWRRERIVFEKMPPGDYVRVEPSLNPDLRAVYFLPDRAQIRNPRHLRALEAACVQRGVEIRPGVEAIDFEIEAGRVAAVRTNVGRIVAGSVVLATGAWSEALAGRLGRSLPTPPLKGQIVLLRPEAPVLRRIVERGRNYLVPRRDGRILVGATEEDAGFDKRTTALGASDLLNEALRLCPGLGSAEIEAQWAGLRPGSVDTRPYIGRWRDLSNLVVATGHKRAGLQLAPATAEVVADLVLEREPRVSLADFAPGREASGEEDPAFRS